MVEESFIDALFGDDRRGVGVEVKNRGFRCAELDVIGDVEFHVGVVVTRRGVANPEVTQEGETGVSFLRDGGRTSAGVAG